MATTNPAEGMSKMDAVRQALSDLGKDAKPLELQPYIKQSFGIDMSVDHVSTYKSQILRKKGKRRGRKPAGQESANGTAGTAAAPAAHAAKKHATGSLSEQVAMLKAVAGAIGKEEAKKILDIL